MHLLTLLFTSQFFSDPSGLNLFFVSFLLLLHRSRISAVFQGFFFWRCLLRIYLAVSVTAVLKLVIIESMSASSLVMMVRGANFQLILTWKVFQHIVILQLLGVFCVLACLFFLDKGGRLSSASHGYFKCMLLENFEFWQCLLLMRSASHEIVISLDVVLSIWAMPCPSSGCFLMTKSVCQHKITKGGKQSLVISHLFCHCTSVHKPVASFHEHPCPLLHSSLLAQ